MNIQWNGVMAVVTAKFIDSDQLDLVNFEINIEALIKVVKTQELIVIYC